MSGSVQPLILDTVVPCTAVGAISEQGLLQYVRHVRSQPFDGVLLFGDLSRGELLNLQEREEIYSHWRSGLTPESSIFISLTSAPAVGITPESLRDNARHAVELGADALVLPHEVKLTGDYEIPVYRLVRSGAVNGGLFLHDTTAQFRTTPIANESIAGFLEQFMKSDAAMDAPQAVLWAHEHMGIISPQFAHDPGWFPTDTLKARIRENFMRRLKLVQGGT